MTDRDLALALLSNIRELEVIIGRLPSDSDRVKNLQGAIKLIAESIPEKYKILL